jgi:hypothetical protein
VGIKKGEFDGNFEFAEKVAKKLMRKKVIYEKVTEKWIIFTFITVCKSFPPITFFG